MEQELLEKALVALGAVLADQGAQHELFVIGGGSLLLTAFIERPTEDIDVVALGRGADMISAEPLPDDLAEAIVDVANLFGLASNWLNAGPTRLLDFGLPRGFRGRTKRTDYGGLVVHHAGRLDQVCFKFYATVDQGPRSKHAQDLRALEPSKEELEAAAHWSRTHDTSDAFATQATQVIAWMVGGDGEV